MTPTLIPAARLQRQTELVLLAWGMRPDLAATSAAVMTDTDLSGIDSHGVSMLIMYDAMRRAGQINLDASPRVVRRTAVTALIDADAGLGHPAATMAMTIAADMAAAKGIGWVSVRNSHHFGAVGNYVLQAAERGMIGLVCSSTRTVSVVPTFGLAPLLGTNPIAMAAPAGRHPPIVLDMSTSVVAVNKVKIYAFKEQPLPSGWVTDAAGQAVTSSALAYRMLAELGEGGLTPVGGNGMALGGHKGYGLGIFAQVLGSTLAGGSFSPIRNRTQQPHEPDNIGHCFMALDPSAFRERDDFLADVDALIDTLRATAPADPAQPVLIPGDPERAERARRLRDGIPMPPSLMAAIAGIVAAAGVDNIIG